MYLAAIFQDGGCVLTLKLSKISLNTSIIAGSAFQKHECIVVHLTSLLDEASL